MNDSATSMDTDFLYTPQSRSAVYGQAHAENAFIQAWQSGRPHHAWLLTGNQGIGKATFAYHVAKFILHQGADKSAGAITGAGDMFDDGDAEPLTLSVPQDCQTVHLINSGAHPDFRVLSHMFNEKEKATTIIDVEQARKVAHLLRQKPSMGTWRVLIVDAVDDLNHNSANAILKLLEEPPANTIFLLVCHSLGKILPTIRSRCRTLALASLSDTDITTIVQEQISDVDTTHLNAVIKMAGGSAGVALDLLENGALEILGDFVSILGDLPHLNMVKIQALGNSVAGAKNRDKLKTMRYISTQWSHKFMRTMVLQQPYEEILQGEQQLFERLSMLADSRRWQQGWDSFFDKINLVDAPSYLDPKQVIADGFVSLHNSIHEHGTGL